jgi:ERF superfamily
MQTRLDYKRDFLCVLSEFQVPDGKCSRTLVKEWYPVREANPAEIHTLCGHPVTTTDSEEGIYVDEEGNVFQLLEKGETKPIEVERLPEPNKTQLEVLLEASLNGTKTKKQTGDSKKKNRKNPNNARKLNALQTNGSAPQSPSPETTASAPHSSDAADTASEAPLQLNLRQKLAEVRRRIGYVQKRGHNERFNYSYVTAADIAGSVGDILAELGIIVVPRLQDISYESAAGRGEATRMARVVMAYAFTDVDSGEEIIAKVAGQGLDPGDKAPYKAMTGALKYALLQSFLLATRDDPEDDRLDRFTPPNAERLISGEQVRELQTLIDDTGTELERVLAYYKVGSLSELTETAHRRAMEVLNRKLAKRGSQETVHAHD